MKLTAQMARIDGATNNVGNAISFNQTQDGYLQKIGDALNRMSELAVLAQDITKSTGDRALYDQEFQTLDRYISDVATKDFNGVSLFNGNSLSVTVDSEANLYQMSGVDLGNATYAALTADSIATLSGPANATQSLSDVKSAINQLAADRASLGAHIETLTMYSDQLGTLKNNLSSANSRIMDVDVAQESTQYAKYSILVQTGTAMLSQANALPQSALKLLQ